MNPSKQKLEEIEAAGNANDTSDRTAAGCVFSAEEASGA
jgi:hypothetical protein